MHHAKISAGQAVSPKKQKPSARYNAKRPLPSDVAMILTFCPKTGEVYAGHNIKAHNYGQLTVATGKIESGEKPYQAAISEANEEGCFRVKLIGKQPIAVIQGKGLHERALTFHVFISIPELKDGVYEKPSDSYEICHWRKYPITDLLRWDNISSKLKEALQAFSDQYDEGKFDKIQFFKDTPPLF